MPLVKCDNTESFLNDEKKETLEPKSNYNDDEPNISTCWTKVPGMGLICIIIKNILGGVSDCVAKKIENIGKFIAQKTKLNYRFFSDSVSLIFYRSLIMLGITISWGIVKVGLNVKIKLS